MAIKKSELYSSLWKSCDELRGGMDASQYKDYVLVLLFIKYVSDKFAGQRHPLIEVPGSRMSTEERHQITVNGLVVDVVRKDIKNLHLAVYPPAGRIRVAAPLRIDDEAVRLFIISKLAWIKRQQAKFQNQERQSEREFISGESHYYQGHRYLLNVVYQEGSPLVAIRNNRILDLFVRPGSDTLVRERLLTNWYRRQLKEAIAPLIPKWEATIGV